MCHRRFGLIIGSIMTLLFLCFIALPGATETHDVTNATALGVSSGVQETGAVACSITYLGDTHGISVRVDNGPPVAVHMGEVVNGFRFVRHDDPNQPMVLVVMYGEHRIVLPALEVSDINLTNFTHSTVPRRDLPLKSGHARIECLGDFRMHWVLVNGKVYSLEKNLRPNVDTVDGIPVNLALDQVRGYALGTLPIRMWGTTTTLTNGLTELFLRPRRSGGQP